MMVMALFALGMFRTQAAVYTFNESMDNGRGEVRTATMKSAPGAKYPANGSTVPGKLTTSAEVITRVGEYKNQSKGISQISRSVLKFGFSADELAEGETVTNATLRLFVFEQTLEDWGPGSSVLLYHSLSDEADTENVASDFESAAFSLIGPVDGLGSTTQTGLWYEVDVTDAVLADLSNDAPDSSAGSSFRLQLNDDLLLDPADKLTRIDFENNTSTHAPQLVIKTFSKTANVGLVSLFSGALLFFQRRKVS